MTTSTEVLTDKFLEIINQLQTTVSAHGQEAVNLALASIQIDALGNIISGIVASFGVYFLYRFGKWIFRQTKEEESSLCDQDEIFYIYSIIAGLGSIALFICSLILLFDIWNYVAIINPKLYLAHTIVDHVLSAAK
jgi:hypothetical protein